MNIYWQSGLKWKNINIWGISKGPSEDKELEHIEIWRVILWKSRKNKTKGKNKQFKSFKAPVHMALIEISIICNSRGRTGSNGFIGWLSWLSTCLCLRSWCRGAGIKPMSGPLLGGSLFLPLPLHFHLLSLITRDHRNKVRRIHTKYWVWPLWDRRTGGESVMFV